MFLPFPPPFNPLLPFTPLCYPLRPPLPLLLAWPFTPLYLLGPLPPLCFPLALPLPPLNPPGPFARLALYSSFASPLPPFSPLCLLGPCPFAGFPRPRHANFSWATFDTTSPFDPTRYYTWLTETTVWQYTFSVPHNVEGMIRAYGGEHMFLEKLDEFFDKGHYNHGNEPDHHVLFLYAYVPGAVWKIQHHLPTIIAKEYGHTGGGLFEYNRPSTHLFDIHTPYPIPTHYQHTPSIYTINKTLSTHPINTHSHSTCTVITPSQHTLSLNLYCQHTLPSHPTITPYQHTLSTHPINTPSHSTCTVITPSQHTLSLNLYCQHTLSTHPLTQPTERGLAGNEDAGQMSAWLVLSSVGFYQVCPGCGGANEYILGLPQFAHVEIRLPCSDARASSTSASTNSTSASVSARAMTTLVIDIVSDDDDDDDEDDNSTISTTTSSPHNNNGVLTTEAPSTIPSTPPLGQSKTNAPPPPPAPPSPPPPPAPSPPRPRYIQSVLWNGCPYNCAFFPHDMLTSGGDGTVNHLVISVG